MQYTVYIFYKILEYFRIFQNIPKYENFVGMVIVLYKSTKSGHQSIGFYKSYKIS